MWNPEPSEGVRSPDVLTLVQEEASAATFSGTWDGNLLSVASQQTYPYHADAAVQQASLNMFGRHRSTRVVCRVD